MPKRHMKGRKGTLSYRAEAGKTVKCVFSHIVSNGRATTGLTQTQVNLTTANLGDRLSTMSENYEFFRVVELEILSSVDTIVPIYATNSVALGGGVLHAISFVNTPSTSRTAANTLEQQAQDDRFEYGPVGQRCYIKVGRRDLLSEPLKWFNTFSTGSPGTETLTAGVVTCSLQLAINQTVTTVTQVVLLRGVAEFHSPIDPADSFRIRVPRAILEAPAVEKAVEKLKAAVKAASDVDT